MKIDITDFRVGDGEAVDLGKRPIRIDPVCKSKGDYKKRWCQRKPAW